MHRHGSRLLLSASDLVTFHECEHASALDRAALDDATLRAERCAADPTGELMQRRGNEFEAAYLAELKRQHRPGAVIEIAKDWRNVEKSVEETNSAMAAGAEIVYQATLQADDLLGHADFLRKVPGRRSCFGDHAYEPVDTKLGRKPKASYVLQLSFYGALLSRAQGAEPEQMHVVLGSRQQVSYAFRDYSKYFGRLLGRFRASVSRAPGATYPTPCARCDLCHWRVRCEDQRAKEDSLWLVAGIRSSQVQKLQASGVHTLEQLGRLPETDTVPALAQASFLKLREQAELQWRGRLEGKLLHRLVNAGSEGASRGFALLPRPDAGDVYFDMEGDPIHGEGGLEYLFGVLYRDAGPWRFQAFWAHDRRAERDAFEQFMDWLQARLERYPNLHVYHYAAYEDSALKRLSGRHATREAFLDRLLRECRLVDLYKVTREAIRASTPSYSIKDIERFYRGARQGDVQTAGASIVSYETWLETRDDRLLEEIERYNEDDVRSLQQLHEWLLPQRPDDLPWRGEDAGSDSGDPAGNGRPSEKLQAYLDAVEAVRRPLLAGLPRDAAAWSPRERARALMADLLEFHRRCEKPQWWETFARAEQGFDELLDSVDAVAGLERVNGRGAAPDEYQYPAQAAKFEDGDYAVWLEHPERATVRILEIDEHRRRIRLAPTRKSGALPERLSLGKGGPFDTRVLKDALLRVGRSVADGERRYRALEAFLSKDSPRLRGRRRRGQPIVADPGTPLDAVTDAIARLDRSYLFIQGPPGAGKTYTGAHVIAALLRSGKRVAVSSTSHKAINNLLAAVEKAMLGHPDGCGSLRACKKVSGQDSGSFLNGAWIVDVDDNTEALDDHWALVGGTAWLLAREEADQQFDYLFVDEAGQVSLGNLAAMATCARNLVLLGDQMQLGQPIQGVHPGRSGESSLEYLLDGRATVPPELGIFLSTTWRMCPDVCSFISAAIYDDRLQPEPKNANQRLVLPDHAHPALQPTGVVFRAMEHVGCSQESQEEADEALRIYEALLGISWDAERRLAIPAGPPASWVDRDGTERPLTSDDILIVAPYNVQVKRLKRTLPPEARVGTVDKFQGQEAAVTLVSMTTSSEDDLPRHLEFLFSRNRLNVAISRARCLSIVLANPRLLDTRCRSPEEIALVNTLCWAAQA